MPGVGTGGAHDCSAGLPLPVMPLLYALPGFGEFRGQGGGGGGGCAVRGIACQRCRTGGQRREGAECELLPSPFYALHRLCPLALRSRAGRLLSLWLFVLRKNTALSRGWCMPLTRGSAVCGAKRIAQHANPGLLSSPVRLSAFPQNVTAAARFIRSVSKNITNRKLSRDLCVRPRAWSVAL